MKVGTDGVLLACWLQTNKPKNILDIGSGTGVISLILAQRFETAKIISVDINKNAFIESNINFESSKWSNRLECLHTPVQLFNPKIKFDLIVSNPPFFSNKSKPNQLDRSEARHDDTLNLEELLTNCKRLINKNGSIAIIIPFEKTEVLKQILCDQELYLSKLCEVKGKEKSSVKRILVEIQTKQKTLELESLVIEKSRHEFSNKYKELCKDFYLKF